MMPTVCTRPVAALYLPVLLVCVSACDIATANFTAQETAEWRQSYEIEPGGRVEISNVNGAIEVEAADGTTVEVLAVKRVRAASPEAAREALEQVTITEEVSPRGVKLETAYPSRSALFNRGGAEVRYTVKVPRTAEVHFRTVNGGIDVRGVSGSVHARTTNGGIRARELGGAVDASTTNGGVDVEVTRVADGGVKLSCTNGGISLDMPAAARATISATVTNGGIDADGLTLERSESTRRRLEAHLNGGGAAVRLSGTNGGIRIRGR